MRNILKAAVTWFASLFSFMPSFGQINQPYTAAFIGRMGVDTVLVETYTMINNHLYGKAFVRVPEDYVREFSVHFYPNGSIREFNDAAMDPINSSVPFKAISNALAYRTSMNCLDDTCTFYISNKNSASEIVSKRAASKIDFVGGWVPLISVIEWHCMRLAKSGKNTLPLKLVNNNIGIFDIGINYMSKDTMAFGGPFLEYTKIEVDQNGRILNTNGIGTPWNYYVTRHKPIDIDLVARRMAKTKGIGIPSPTETVTTRIKNSKIEVRYGRPYKRGRQIFGAVVPYDSVWRTGADKATLLTLENTIRIGKTTIPKGQYSLYTIPQPKEWRLIFNKDLQKWPTDPDREADFASVLIPAKKVKEVAEQFTINIQETKKGGVLQFYWDDVVALAEFSVIKE